MNGPLLIGKHGGEVMRKTLLMFLIVLSLCHFVRPAAGKHADFSLRIVNNSSSEINRIHLAWKGTRRWGPNLLVKQVLGRGKDFTAPGLSAGDYDILFVDASGRQCVAAGIPIYRDTSWVVTDEKCPKR